jgi:hypothetical protein
MQRIKEPESSAAVAANGPNRTEVNGRPGELSSHGLGKRSAHGLGNEPIRTGERLGRLGRLGRAVRHIASLGCMLSCLHQPAEAVGRRSTAPPLGQVLSKGPPGPLGPPVLQPEKCLNTNWGRVHPAVLALKRPRPGSIWQGPKELWCLLPQAREAGALRPAEAEDSDAPPAEDSPPPPYLSPLLLFLMTLPTIEEVASYFAEALGEAPVIDGPQRLRFERLLAFAWGKSWRRCVLSGEARGAPGVTLDWWTNDDFGLSELREFFEAPFFSRCESVRFYQWLGEGGAHEADFRGHRMRMVMGRRDGILFVRIQWWRSAPDAEGSQGLLDFETLEQVSAPAGTLGGSEVCVQRAGLHALISGQSQPRLRHFDRFARQEPGCPPAEDKNKMQRRRIVLVPRMQQPI